MQKLHSDHNAQHISFNWITTLLLWTEANCLTTFTHDWKSFEKCKQTNKSFFLSITQKKYIFLNECHIFITNSLNCCFVYSCMSYIQFFVRKENIFTFILVFYDCFSHTYKFICISFDLFIALLIYWLAHSFIYYFSLKCFNHTYLLLLYLIVRCPFFITRIERRKK